MLGRVCWGDGRKARLEEERLLGLPLLKLVLPQRARGREQRLDRALRLLAEQRVSRVLTPAEFEEWPALARQGLREVDTQALRCALTPAWTQAVLAERGIGPERAVLLLTGPWESPDMARVARALCPLVRNLVIDVPRGGTLAAQLRREFGLPVLPPRSARADLTLRFDPGPMLHGARFALPEGQPLPPDCESLPLLSVLWESGRIKAQEIVIQI